MGVELVSDPAARKEHRLDEVIRRFEVEVGCSDVYEGPFTLEVPQMTLPIRIVSASGLRSADYMTGKSDPYCVCEIKGKGGTLKTEVVKRTLNPQWNHLGELAGFAASDDLLFSVYDKDLPGKPSDFLGRVLLKSADFWPQGFDGALKLSDAGS